MCFIFTISYVSNMIDHCHSVMLIFSISYVIISINPITLLCLNNINIIFYNCNLDMQKLIQNEPH